MHLKDLNLPCGKDRPVKLQDGGVYDNMGLEAIDGLDDDELIIAINAGGLFYVRRGYGWIPVIRDFLRVNSILYRQSTALRRREMVERFRAWETAHRAGTPQPPWARRGVLFGLTTTFDDRHPVDPEWADGRPEHADLTQSLARVKTSFARFHKDTCEQLVYRGWWLTGRHARHLPPNSTPTSTTTAATLAPLGRRTGLGNCHDDEDDFRHQTFRPLTPDREHAMPQPQHDHNLQLQKTLDRLNVTPKQLSRFHQCLADRVVTPEWLNPEPLSLRWTWNERRLAPGVIPAVGL